MFTNDSVDANMEDDRTRVNSVLNSNGSVIWVEPVQYSVHCQTDTTHWPYDTQAGMLRLGSWMYNGNVLNLTTYNDEVSNRCSKCLRTSCLLKYCAWSCHQGDYVQTEGRVQGSQVGSVLRLSMYNNIVHNTEYMIHYLGQRSATGGPWTYLDLVH